MAAPAPSAPETESQSLIQVRPATSEDLESFVVPSWLIAEARSLRGKWARADARFGIGRERYWAKQKQRIDFVLHQGQVKAEVAVVEGLQAGWAVSNPTQREVYYVFVKDGFRRQGIARALIGWVEDPSQGMVVFKALPPPWFSRPQDSARLLWASHQVIDTF
jgi:GNAT superfamily N-acetyltransferase